ncbi:hypothetical protein Poli38472_011892 [Pythium oligandrum]|uniref:Uncharacterized protein n=1 Tax=Pythium oligandrum TaxID=41045 RepID=A0A8K1FEU1_PYTOL|nr:hypothetical protein Poli38472_011892 [Pythium oligandrum]|eukprot:TMW58304.1 hypothetical protein Poli38472_011892 [Pythium oligandrum]
MADACQYPSKPCTEPRAIKINGELHRLCEHHRQLANRNQQRLQQRRRLMRQQQAAADEASLKQLKSQQKVEELFAEWFEMEDVLSAVPSLFTTAEDDLCPEDLDFLLQVLISDDQMNMVHA